MGEGDDVEVVSVGRFQIFLEVRLEIDFRHVVVFGPVAVAEIEQDPASPRQDDLRGIAVADRIKNNLMDLRHD
jgi:hypothetical protein